jgi:hypothetical protein
MVFLMEKKVKKITVILVITIVASIVTANGFAQTYQPGHLIKNETMVARLNPPGQDKTEIDSWRREKKIRLFHFSEGEGRTVLSQKPLHPF